MKVFTNYFIRSLFLISFLFIIKKSFGQSSYFFNSPNILNNSYGICSHVSRKGVDWEIRNNNLSKMQEIGIDYFRTDFDWNRLQSPLPSSSFNYVYLDSMMKSAENAQKKVLPILGYGIEGGTPVWQHLNDWSKYVTAIVKRYSTIPIWEVWNEMNLKAFWQDGPSVEHYYKLLEATYKTIKAIDSNKQVLLGGLGGLDKKYLMELLERGGYNYFDIMNFHYYSGVEVPETIIEKCFKPLRGLMLQYNLNKPVWITESGYSTKINKNDKTNFYTDVLPEVYSKIRIKPSHSTVAFIVDDEKKVNCIKRVDIDSRFGMFAHRIKIKLDELKNLDPQKVQLLIPTIDESFPMEYFDDLEDYVRKGGTILLSYGIPLYFDKNISDGKLSLAEDKYRKRLHISCFGWWTPQAVKLQAPKLSDWLQAAFGFSTDYSWDFKSSMGLRYLTADNLKFGDKFIPVLQAGNKNYKGTVVGLYKLNSDLKGNIIVQTRQVGSDFSISEETQAKRLPRMFIVAFGYGIEKVFWYNLRALENDPNDTESFFGILHKDLKPKPAYYAYKTLVTMCPNQSTRPTLKMINDIYAASWRRPDGKNVTAIWTEATDKKINISFKGKIQVYNYMGETIHIVPKNFYASSGITYFIGYKSLYFN